MRTDFAFHNPSQLANFIFPCLVMSLMREFHDVDLKENEGEHHGAAFWNVGAEYIPASYVEMMEDQYDVINYGFIRTFTCANESGSFINENKAAIELILVENKNIDDTFHIFIFINDYDLNFAIDFDKDDDIGFEGKPHAFIHVKKRDENNKSDEYERVVEHYRSKLLNTCKPIINNAFFFVKDENDDITGLN